MEQMELYFWTIIFLLGCVVGSGWISIKLAGIIHNLRFFKARSPFSLYKKDFYQLLKDIKGFDFETKIQVLKSLFSYDINVIVNVGENGYNLISASIYEKEIINEQLDDPKELKKYTG